MRNGLELLTTQQMQNVDRLTIAAGTQGFELMRRAGRAVADVAAALAPGRRIGVLCGPGNNGGDGFVAAFHLLARGFDVTLGLLGPRDHLRGDAAQAADLWARAMAPAEALDLAGQDLVIDALFGAGLQRDLADVPLALVQRLVAWTRETGRPIVAVDVPSGLDGTSGAVRGACAPARATVTFFHRKPGHLLEPGRGLCGRVYCAGIGIPASVLSDIVPTTSANAPALWRGDLRSPAPGGHKYGRGHTLVVSGGGWTSGAARLSARGALRAGAGLVTLASPRDAHAAHAAQVTAIMLKPCDGAGELAAILADRRKNAVVLGPGLGVGAATRALVRTALSGMGPDATIVLDADALTSFAAQPTDLAQAIGASQAQVVITPHDGEFARLFDAAGLLRGRGAQRSPVASKLVRTQNAAASLGATVLLKGSDTVVAAPDGRAAIAEVAAPWLATAGSGDVLAGMIAGLAAQGMPIFSAACAGVWMHARAAALFGPGLISEDLPDLLPRVWAELLA